MTSDTDRNPEDEYADDEYAGHDAEDREQPSATPAIDSSPEDEYADDEYADYDAEDREQPSTPAEIPYDEPEADVLEQRQEIPYGDDDG